MNKSFTISLLTCLVLAGCADTPSKDAPIVERGGPGVASSAAGAGQGGDAAAGAGSQTGMSAGQLETRALAGSGQAQGMDGAGAAAAAGQAGDGKNPLKDPSSILSKRTIYFDFDSAAIREEFRPLVEAHAQYLKDNTQVKTILQGHTDERGSREYNIALGQRRAESVNQAMTLLGVANEQMEAVSMGEEKPMNEGHDEAAWQQNRRVEIHYRGE